MNDWNPIETAPENKEVLVYSKNGISVARRDSFGLFYGIVDGEVPSYDEDQEDWHYEVYDPTHWMPLPNPPEEIK
jgi:hypothetical protein